MRLMDASDTCWGYAKVEPLSPGNGFSIVVMQAPSHLHFLLYGALE